MGGVGIGCPSPIFPVTDVGAALGFYARLGFRTWSYDERYGFAERERLKLHLGLSADFDPFVNASSAWVEVDDADALHAEWAACGLWLLEGAITPEQRTEMRERWARGDRIGRLSPVMDTPWNVREFALLDLDNNTLRFGRPLG